MPEPVVEQCATCKWWQPKATTDKTGECHRYAPYPDGTENRQAKWKITSETTSCGEFKKK